ncbi:MAG: hypothetical protein SF187_04360 [Deltaproteobacteria bacterium]|nr:hypothetical protein [Deltaproteobacteria bacterium]
MTRVWCAHFTTASAAAALASLVFACDGPSNSLALMPGDASSKPAAVDARDAADTDDGPPDILDAGKVAVDAAIGDALGNDGGGEAEEVIDAACAAVASATCGKLEGCAARLFTQRYAGGQTCRQAVAWECENTLRSSGVRWSVAMARECAQRTAGLSCDSWFAQGLPSECEIGAGSLEVGAPCRTAVAGQCKAGTRCAVVEGGCGVCKATLAVGADCTDWSLGCVDQATCVRELAGQARCEAYARPGESCDLRTACVNEVVCLAGRASCVTSVQCSGNECRHAVAQEGDNCKDRPCDPRHALVCNQFTFRCEADVACSDPAGCAGRLELGKACAKPWDCVAPASCVGGRCALPASSNTCG